MSTLLRAEGIRVEAGGRTILDVPGLEVRAGETLVLLGPTGAGKTTLLRVLGFLLRPQEGKLYWSGDGTPLPFPPPLALRRRVAMAFQEPLLFQGTVAENVAWGLGIRGIRGAERSRRVGAALERLGIESLASRPAQQLSGGEAQRTAIARALVLEPELLLLDEPLASLDRVTRRRLADEIRQLLRAGGTTCVYVTHDQPEGLFMADRVVILEKGRIVEIAGPEEIFTPPADPFVAAFVGMENILPGRIVDSAEGLATVEVGSRSARPLGPARRNGRLVLSPPRGRRHPPRHHSVRRFLPQSPRGVDRLDPEGGAGGRGPPRLRFPPRRRRDPPFGHRPLARAGRAGRRLLQGHRGPPHPGFEEQLRMLSVEQARQVVLSLASPLPPREFPLEELLGLVLAQEVVAGENVPPFTNSAMDGFALRAADLAAASETRRCAWR